MRRLFLQNHLVGTAAIVAFVRPVKRRIILIPALGENLRRFFSLGQKLPRQKHPLDCYIAAHRHICRVHKAPVQLGTADIKMIAQGLHRQILFQIVVDIADDSVFQRLGLQGDMPVEGIN